jgi:hypothetical protein
VQSVDVTASTGGERQDGKPPRKLTKEERRIASLSNLRKWQSGETGNPLGAGCQKSQLYREFQAFMASPSDFSESGDSNRLTLWRAMMLSAMGGDAHAQIALLEQDIGVAEKRERLMPTPKGAEPGANPLDLALAIYRERVMSGEMTSVELGEMVRVLLAAEKDKALLFLKALGPKLASLQADKAAELQRQFEADPSKFIGLEAAENSASPPAAQTTAPPRTASEASPPAAGTLSPDPFTEADDDDSI